MGTSETTRLRALLEAAALPACEAHYDGAMGEWSVHGADGERVADVRWHGVEPWPGDGPVTEARAKLCAALPTVLPGLLDEADRLRAELRDARADLAALTALRPRDPRRTGDRSARSGREGAPDEDGLCPWCDGDIAREQELDALRAQLATARREGAEEMRWAASEAAEQWLIEVEEVTQDSPADLADAIRALPLDAPSAPGEVSNG